MMRDVIFKNLTSADRKRRVITSSEFVNQQGMRSLITRHFICIVKEISDNHIEKPLPYVYVLKEHNTKERHEKFLCRLKGSVYAVTRGRLFLIIFMHSLKIKVSSLAGH